jgi:N-acetylmuramoyl-L-alanine amidase
LGINNRGVKNSTDNRHGRLGILDDTRPRAILLEVAFISNKVDMSRYQQNKERLAGTLAQLLVMDVNGNSAIKD